MKYLRGYLAAAIFGAITWILTRYGEKFSALVDMIYPYVIRTLQNTLAQWSSQVDFCLWQLLAVVLGVLVLASIVLMIILKWNPVSWFGWVLAAGCGIYMLHTLVFGLNYYASDLSDDIRMESSAYTLSELAEATEYYRDKANELALRVPRDSAGNVSFDSFENLAASAGEGGLPVPDLPAQFLCLCRFHPARQEAGLGGHVYLHGHHRGHHGPDR